MIPWQFALTAALAYVAGAASGLVVGWILNDAEARSALFERVTRP